MTTIDATIGASVQQASVNFSAGGDNVIIVGVTGQRIKVLQFFFVIGAATNLIYKSGTTALTGTMDFTAAGAHVLDYVQLPLTCNIGDSFLINSSSGVQIGGTIWFSQQ